MPYFAQRGIHGPILAAILEISGASAIKDEFSLSKAGQNLQE
jgi:hypothetical protein